MDAKWHSDVKKWTIKPAFSTTVRYSLSLQESIESTKRKYASFPDGLGLLVTIPRRITNQQWFWDALAKRGVVIGD
jgi:hypothetical protein